MKKAIEGLFLIIGAVDNLGQVEAMTLDTGAKSTFLMSQGTNDGEP